MAGSEEAKLNPRSFWYEIVVQPDVIDELGHVNNAVYLRWVQEAITACWQATAGTSHLERIVWVARRHDITYRRPSLEGDRLVAEVWPSGYAGSRAVFQTRLRRKEELIAEVSSTLCCLDRASRQLVRITRELAEPFIEQ